ncbi:MAG: hypothetical protein QNL03_05375 [Gammaproteobacteria bacterium]|nr:hypothetical protein [Gammaproteobacteria bacterium]
MDFKKSYTTLLLVLVLTLISQASSIAGEVDSALSSDTASIELTAPQVDIFNEGSFEVAMVIAPPNDAIHSVTGVAVDFEPCEVPSLNIEGKWTGTFQCTNFGTTSDQLQPVDLVISRNADGSYHYEDSVAAYDGQLCGDEFKFRGGAAGDYTESGTFLFSSSSSSTRSSNWNGIPPRNMGGTCSDTLQKI